MVDWILDLEILSKGTFISGSCGIGLNFPMNFVTIESQREAKSRVASAIRRYPGLDVPARLIGVGNGLLQVNPNPGEAQAQLSKRTFLKRVNWLSFLNTRQTDLLNLNFRFEERAKELADVTLHGLPHGLCIKAGETPRIGDTSRGDFVPVYQSVTQLIRPVRLESVTGGLLRNALEEQGAADWLAAFDR